jgi:GNAT superfamily N-acetyltransferase
VKVPLGDNPRVTAARAAELAEAAARRGYVARRAGAGDAAALEALCVRWFSRAWAFEVARALEVEGVHVAARAASGELVAFAAHDGNNRGLGWFGPAGTLEAHRGHGLGAALLCACLRDVADAGHAEGVIAWIGPRPFYETIAGAVDDRSFVVMEKTLS